MASPPFSIIIFITLKLRLIVMNKTPLIPLYKGDG